MRDELALGTGKIGGGSPGLVQLESVWIERIELFFCETLA